jgi:hypothetical protein
VKPGGADWGPYGPEVVVFEDQPPTLEHAQKIVGGYVEIVYLPNGDQMLVAEEGLLKQLPVNPQATFLAGKMIVGNALVLRGGAKWD